MNLSVLKVELSHIIPLRKHFLEEVDYQIRYDSVHSRGWSDSYLIRLNGIKAGYASVKGKEHLSGRDAIFEFYLLPEFRSRSSIIFSKLIQASDTTYIECQSNDPFLTPLLYEYAESLCSDVILFEGEKESELKMPKVIFRKRKDRDEVFEHDKYPGNYVLEKSGTIVASGGFLTHYNPPYADLYMEVKEEHRRQGWGSFILQEIKKECYAQSLKPAARCNISNPGSRAALLKAGFRICGCMLTGIIKR